MSARSRLTLAVLCASALSGCGSPAADINFQPPGQGWTATPAILGRTQVWMKNEPNSKTHNSLVILVRGIGKNDNLIDNPGVGASGSRVVKNDQTTICGNQRADHFIATGTYHGVGAGSANGRPQTFEAFVSTVRDVRYMAIYIRPQNESPDPQAETAIRSLCPKSA